MRTTEDISQGVDVSQVACSDVFINSRDSAPGLRLKRRLKITDLHYKQTTLEELDNFVLIFDGEERKLLEHAVSISTISRKEKAE